MHTIKLLLTYYLNISVQAANLSDCRIESKKIWFRSENRIESKLFCPNWNALLTDGVLYAGCSSAGARRTPSGALLPRHIWTFADTATARAVEREHGVPSPSFPAPSPFKLKLCHPLMTMQWAESLAKEATAFLRIVELDACTTPLPVIAGITIIRN